MNDSGEKVSFLWSVADLLRGSFKRVSILAAHAAETTARSEDSIPTPQSRAVSHPRPSRTLGVLRPSGCFCLRAFRGCSSSEAV